MAYNYSEEASYYVDNETKEIAIDDRQPIIAGENISHYVKINLNSKYIDGVDVSEMDIVVDWHNTGGGSVGHDAVINLDVTDELEFGWVIRKEACLVPGDLIFRVRITGPDGYVWKSKDALKKIIKSEIDNRETPDGKPAVWVSGNEVTNAVNDYMRDHYEGQQSFVTAHIEKEFYDYDIDWRLNYTISGGVRQSGKTYRMCFNTPLYCLAGSRFSVPADTRANLFVYSSPSFGSTNMIESIGLTAGMDYVTQNDGYIAIAMGFGTSDKTPVTEENYEELASKLTCEFLKRVGEIVCTTDGFFRPTDRRSIDNYVNVDNVPMDVFLQTILDDSKDGELVIPPKTYEFGKTLYIPGGIRIVGSGVQSVLKLSSGGTYDQFDWRTELKDGREPYPRPFVAIKVNGDNCVLENFAIDGGTYVTEDTMMALRVSGSGHILRNLTVHHIDMGALANKGYGIHIFDANNIVAENCHCYRCGYEGFGIEKARNVVVNGGYFHDCKQVPIQIHRRSFDIYINGITSERGTVDTEYPDNDQDSTLSLHGTPDYPLGRVTVNGSYFSKNVYGVQGGEHNIRFDNCHVENVIFNRAAYATDDGWIIRGCRVNVINLYGKNHMVVNNILGIGQYAGYVIKFGTEEHPTAGGCIAYGNNDISGHGCIIKVDDVAHRGQYPPVTDNSNS